MAEFKWSPKCETNEDEVAKLTEPQKKDYAVKCIRAQVKADYAGEPVCVVIDGGIAVFGISTMAEEYVIPEDVLLFKAYPNED